MAGVGRCWVIPQYESRGVPQNYDGELLRVVRGLPGMPPDFANEEDGNFMPLTVLYITAAVVSIAGALTAVRLHTRVRRAGLAAYCAYFMVQVGFNVGVLGGFLANRCLFHNTIECVGLSYTYEDADGAGVCEIVGGAWSVAAKVAFLSAFAGGILTNGLLELGVVLSLRALSGSRRKPSRSDRALYAFVLMQLACLLVAMPLLIGIFFFLVVRGVEYVMQRLKQADAVSSDSTAEGIHFAQVVLSTFGVFHVAASLWLLAKAMRLACERPPSREASRLALASGVAICSSVFCYANFAGGWINWYIALACDSIINDACVVALLLSGDPSEYNVAAETTLELTSEKGLQEPARAFADCGHEPARASADCGRESESPCDSIAKVQAPPVQATVVE